MGLTTDTQWGKILHC